MGTGPCYFLFAVVCNIDLILLCLYNIILSMRVFNEFIASIKCGMVLNNDSSHESNGKVIKKVVKCTFLTCLPKGTNLSLLFASIYH